MMKSKCAAAAGRAYRPLATIAMVSAALLATGTARAADVSEVSDVSNKGPGDASAAHAGPTGATGTATLLREVHVKAPPVRAGDGINLPESTSSRLGLRQLDTPATVNVITPETMLKRGYDQADAAVDSAPGVTSGGTPGDPSQFSMRGFTGNEVTMLRDGNYVGPASMVYRPLNTFNLQSVEVLQGPASLLYGQGAVGGVVNTITKKPQFGRATSEFYTDYGSFNTFAIGAGFNAQVNDKLAVRLDVSRTSSSGYVSGSNPNSLDVTGSALWKITPTVTLLFSLDYMRDQLSSYYGTPLIPLSAARNPVSGILSSSQGLTIDRDMLGKNYNVNDSLAASESFMPRVVLTWQATPDITVSNELTYYHANRWWRNAETYTYVTPTTPGALNAAGQPIAPGQIARDRFHVYQNQNEVIDRSTVVLNKTIFGLPNRMSFGIEGDYIRFIRNSGFPDATFADSVDPYNPNRGSYGSFPGDETSRRSPTTIVDGAAFAEDILSLTPKLKLVSGVRFDVFDLDRQNYSATGVFNQATSFHSTYFPNNYRIGTIYEITPHTSVYASFTTAQDPPNSNVFLANAGQISGLSAATQEEVGLKSSFLNGRGDATLALYHINRTNILVATGPDTVANAGSEHSYGAEFSGNLALTRSWSVNGNAAYTDAHYGVFLPSASVNASGNIPPDVPRVTANMWTEYRNIAHTPLDIGGGIRFVGNQTGDFANTLHLNAYTVVNIYAAYHLSDKVTLRARIDNLFNRTYVQWVDTNYPTQVLIGEPRFFGLSLYAAL